MVDSASVKDGLDGLGEVGEGLGGSQGVGEVGVGVVDMVE